MARGLTQADGERLILRGFFHVLDRIERGKRF
jgi:Fe-S cluster assembly scaffold protein SufB